METVKEGAKLYIIKKAGIGQKIRKFLKAKKNRRPAGGLDALGFGLERR